MGQQDFQLGSANVNINLGMSQWNSNCAKTYAHYVWNNSTQLWDAFSG